MNYTSGGSATAGAGVLGMLPVTGFSIWMLVVGFVLISAGFAIWRILPRWRKNDDDS